MHLWNGITLYIIVECKVFISILFQQTISILICEILELNKHFSSKSSIKAFLNKEQTGTKSEQIRLRIIKEHTVVVLPTNLNEMTFLFYFAKNLYLQSLIWLNLQTSKIPLTYSPLDRQRHSFTEQPCQWVVVVIIPVTDVYHLFQRMVMKDIFSPRASKENTPDRWTLAITQQQKSWFCL